MSTTNEVASEPTPTVDQHLEYKYRDQGGLMKALNWTGVTVVGLPIIALIAFGSYKIMKKKKPEAKK